MGWYVYRGMVNTTLLEVAFAPELAGKGIGKAQSMNWEDTINGTSTPTLTSAWRETWRFWAGGSKTSRAWPTATCKHLASSHVTATTLR